MTLWKKFANNGISAVIREFSRITEFANNGRFCWQMDMPVFAKFTVSLFDIFNLKGNEAFAYDFVTSYANKILNCKYYNNTAEI